MPELPEVETIVRDLRKKVLKRTFLDVWVDTPKIIKRPKDFEKFKKEVKNKKILKIRRRAKNIIFELSGDCILLIHQKLTGHLLYGLWELGQGRWIPKIDDVMKDRVNTYIHLLFYLDNGKMLALSDLRKFAKVELWEKEEFYSSKDFKNLGPEPLDKDFTFNKFKEIFKNPLFIHSRKAAGGEPRQRRGKIKQVLMDPKVIAGIGNIYSDEILWRSKVHPQKNISELEILELKSIYQNIKKVLLLAIKLRGESISDFRDLQGKKGFFDTERRVYQREGEKCSRCGELIRRLKIGGRSAHFCPNCQVL